MVIIRVSFAVVFALATSFACALVLELSGINRELANVCAQVLVLPIAISVGLAIVTPEH